MHATDVPMPEATEPSPAVAWLLAALSFGAGVIHLAMVPQHAQESLGMGLAFAAAGWFQLVFGAAMVARPGRRWVRVAVVANLAFVATWAWSRTVGLPGWTGDGGVEPAATADLVVVGFEAALVVAAVAVLLVPDLLRSWTGPALVVASIVPIGILVATTAVITSPSTATHGHGGAEELAAGADPAASADHAHDADAAADTGHAHDDTGASMTAGDGHQHGESEITLAELPPATRSEVDQVIAAWATKYPTGGDAIAAGWMKATPNLYGIGSHYIKDVSGFSVAKPFSMLEPNILLYDGEGPDAKFAGVSYVVARDVDGFTGDFDFWHGHATICMKDAKISLTEASSPYWYSEAECTAAGGQVRPIAGDKMIHLWIGPGYTDAPIFAHDNPEIYDGYYPKQAA